MTSPANRTVAFFDSQFERQTRAGDFALNPFEKIALPYLKGRVLDMGCGLGNLTIEGARRGCSVVALDASPNAIARIKQAASAEALPIRAEQVDFESHRLSEMFDAVVAIGLFVFFPKNLALELLADAQRHVVAGGVIVVNVLVEGTTYLGMFEPGCYYLFSETELLEHFKDWNVVESRHDAFPAPGETVKEFMTLIARR